MLNKEICIQCRATRGTKWDAHADEDWQYNSVCCGGIFGPTHSPISKGPPKHCPYAIEHLMSENK